MPEMRKAKTKHISYSKWLKTRNLCCSHIVCESKKDQEEWLLVIQQAVLDLHNWMHSVKFVIPFTSEKQYSSDTHLVDHQSQPDKIGHSSSKTSLIKIGKKGSNLMLTK